VERENLTADAGKKARNGSNRETEDTDAPERERTCRIVVMRWV
jgi:hypothetical protein